MIRELLTYLPEFPVMLTFRISLGQAFCNALSTSVCTQASCSGCKSNAASSIAQSATPAFNVDEHGQMIPCSDAWRQLKGHPNIGSANLQMLAEVVAHRSQCDTSTTMLPASPLASQSANNSITTPQPTIASMTLVPESALRASALEHRKRLRVDSSGVQAALALLDKGFGSA